jgi:hypothetical protein
MTEKFTAYITKYALTTGIQEMFVEHSPEFAGMVREVTTGGAWAQAFHNKDWHRTKEEAVKRAEEMREKKLASIEEQIKRIKALKFG